MIFLSLLSMSYESMNNTEEVNDDSIPCWMFDEAQAKTSTNKRSTTNYLSYTDETVVKRVYILARILHDTLMKSGITYWATGGTLLGCVRHKGLIPWDDDLDLCIYKKDTSKIEHFKNYLSNSNCEILEVQEFGYRVFHRTESEKLPSEYQKHRFPFCDIFVMKSSSITSQIAAGTGRALWPEEYYYNKDIDKMESRLFGDVYLNCTSNPEEYLGRTYREHWLTHGSTHNYNHIVQEYVNPVRFELTSEHLHPAKPFR